jgi:hypothetical protein
MDDEKPKKGIALILEGGPKAADSSGELQALDDGELEAMQAFEEAETTEEKAKALKDFIKLCTSSGEY